MKKIYICVISAVMALLLCSCGDDDSFSGESRVGYPICTHDENYTEPTVKTGKYYLNGDKNSYYFEVTANTIELCGVDLSELYDSWQPWGSNVYEGVGEETAKQRIEQKDYWIDEWTGPKSYTVKTLHEINDKVTLVTKEVVTSDGFILSNGLTLKDEKTITGFGKDGDFVLAE